MMTATANICMRPETIEVERDVFRRLILLKGLNGILEFAAAQRSSSCKQA
jgi:hypothetical protein